MKNETLNAIQKQKKVTFGLNGKISFTTLNHNEELVNLRYMDFNMLRLSRNLPGSKKDSVKNTKNKFVNLALVIIVSEQSLGPLDYEIELLDEDSIILRDICNAGMCFTIKTYSNNTNGVLHIKNNVQMCHEFYHKAKVSQKQIMTKYTGIQTEIVNFQTQSFYHCLG